jgi:outer membrane immunogenic protein
MNSDDTEEDGTYEVSIDENWEASLRLRLGMVIDDTWMPYITGGVAWADVDAAYRTVPNGSWQSASETLTGWTLGAGVEYKITENFHAKLEYRYADYGDMSDSWGGTIPDTKTDFKTSKVYMGVSYKF